MAAVDLKRHLIGVFLLWMVATGLIACGTHTVTPPVLPTRVDLARSATETYLATHSPPDAYRVISLPGLDDNLLALSGWHYDVLFSFEGVFSGTDRPATYHNTLKVAYNQVRPARRVVADIVNGLQGDADPLHYEALRLGTDVYLVQNDICLSNSDETAQVAVDLGADDILGGIEAAPAAAQRAVINGTDVYRYNFSMDNIRFSQIQLTENSSIQNLTGELWYTPQYDAVIRFYLTLTAENILLLDNNLPVSGTLQMRYDVFDIGTAPNLTVPFGC